MIKIYILFLIFFFNNLLQAQEFNQHVNDKKSGKPMLIGYTTREAFQDSTFEWWFNSNYENYSLNRDTLDLIIPYLEKYDITVISGTWCSDSRRELPRFFKILDSAGYDNKKVKLISVGRDKEDITGEVDSLSLEYVPTFIFYSEGKEKGRIVEAPKSILEGDIWQIIRKSQFITN